MLTRHPLRLTVLMLALMAGLAFGQGLTGFGVKAGLNLANVSGEDVGEVDPIMKLGFAVGGSATFDFGLPVLIRPEVLFSQKGYEINEEETVLGQTFSVEADFGVNYLDINLLAVYAIGDKINVFAGPSLGLFLSGKTKIKVAFAGESVEEEVDIESDGINGMDMGLMLGAGYNLGAIGVDLRYSLGLKEAYKADTSLDPDIVKMEVVDIKNNVIQVIVGYSF